MTTQEVADRFYELAQQGRFDQIQEEFYSEDIVSIEPDYMENNVAKGMDALRVKGKQWNEMIEEMHGGYTNKPQVAGNYFSCTMGMDVSLKGQGRTTMDEVAVYKVDNGKIVLEQFFF